MFILDVLFPKRCVGCGSLGEHICSRCKFSVKHIDPVKEGMCPVCEKPAAEGVTHPVCKRKYAPDGLVSFFRYDKTVKKALKSVKYKLATCVAEDLIRLAPLTSYNFILNKTKPENTFIVPIPLHKKRIRERGFNQAEIYAGLISAELKIPIRKDILKRVRYTDPQVEMKSREKRLSNMNEVFSCSNSVKKSFNKDQDINILLLDDIFTTGATIRSATNMLKRTGFKHVWAVTIAR